MKKTKMRNISRNKFILLSFTFITLLVVEAIIGEFQDINIIAFATFLIYIYIIYIIDTRFILEYFWFFVSCGLNLLGLFVCDKKGIYLVELACGAKYVNAFIPQLIVYVIFFCTAEVVRIMSRKRVIHNEDTINRRPKKSCIRTTEYILIIGIIIAFFLFIKVMRNPIYGLVGDINRLIYASDYMSDLERSLKSYLPLFIPIAAMLLKNKKKFLPVLFCGITLIYYFWTGDKFGAYYTAIYIFIISFCNQIETKKLKPMAITLVVCVFSLLGIVYIQRILLYNETYNLFIEAISQRLAQQGEVWWSVYQQDVGGPLRPVEFLDELKAILPFSNVEATSVGQWKMMLVSSRYSDYAYYRVSVGNPYTTTTAASIFYYFKWFGLVLFYPIAAFFYSKVIQEAIYAIDHFYILESMISIKMILIFHSLLGASDLYILSYKGLLYIVALMVLVYLRKKHKRIVLLKGKSS